jgi:phosphoribosylamine--glycine ligase
MDGVENVPIRADDVAALRDFAAAQAVDLTIVGPEAPLAAGIVDAFQAAGLPIFGPTQAAARLESSKVFAKEFMQRHAIPTGQARTFDALEPALAYLHGLAALPVIKASGLAAGKGVILPNTRTEAEAALHSMLAERHFGNAGDIVLLEERLVGPELSVLAFCDGKTLRLLPAAQDHKRLLNDDRGPNTGGMGAYAPAPLMTPALQAQVERKVLLPTLRGMAAEGMPYVGVLYAGLMLTPAGLRVLEFNCRLGDPETQALLPLLKSDLVEVIQACVAGRLDTVEMEWRNASAVTVVMAAGGYPDDYATGDPISGIAAAEAQGCTVFHAGTALRDGQVVTAGGRVLSVTGIAPSLREAIDRAYAGVAQIKFADAHHRTDIARRATETGT